MSLVKLPDKTVKLLKSTQVISSISSVVKELTENALDAGASSIVIKLTNYGFGRIEVKDNGSGIPEDDMEFVAKAHFTSKISSFDDLCTLNSYGFRGEALSSLCEISDVIVTTKLEHSSLGYIYKLSTSGEILEKTPTAATKGTNFCIQNIFKNVPVRKQFYKTTSRKREELKKIEEYVLSYSVIKPNLYISLSHDGCLIYQKQPENNISKSLYVVFKEAASKLTHISKEKNDILLDVWLPSKIHVLEASCSRNSVDRLFIFANERHIHHKLIEKMIKASYSQNFEGTHGKYPIGVVVVKVPTQDLDVNFEPNKQTVMFRAEDTVMEVLGEILQSIYGKHDLAETFLPNKDQTELPCTVSFNESETSTTYVDLSPKPKEKIHPKRKQPEPELPSSTTSVKSDNPSSINENSFIYGINEAHSSTKHLDGTTSQVLANVTNLEEQRTPRTVNGDSHGNEKMDGIQDIPEKIPSLFDLLDEDDILSNNSSVSNPMQTSNAIMDKGSTIAHEKLEKVAPVSRNIGDANPSVNVGELAWSRGDALPNMNNVQPVNLLRPEPCLRKQTTATTPPTKRLKKDPFASKEVFSPQGLKVRKPDSAFSIFAKEIRHEILSEFPGKDFTVVAQEIAAKWKTLSPSEKQMYDQKSSQMKREFQSSMKVQKNKSILSMMDVSVDRSLERVVAPSTPMLSKTKTTQEIPETKPWQKRNVKIKFDINKFRSQREPIVDDQGPFRLGQGWISLDGGHLIGINAWRLQEMILYINMMKTISVPLEKLESPIMFNQSVLGEECWNALLEMTRDLVAPVSAYSVSDSRITSNGLQILLFPDKNSMITHGEIESVTTVMAFFGIHDLKDILRKIVKSPNCTLEQCRPLKLVNWMKGEVVRMQRESPLNTNKMELAEKMKQWYQLKKADDSCSDCLHFKPIVHQICEIGDKLLKKNMM